MFAAAGFAYYVFSNKSDHVELPPFKPYEYLRRRNRDDRGFPWGKESLFFNPHVNVSESQWDEAVRKLNSGEQ